MIKKYLVVIKLRNEERKVITVHSTYMIGAIKRVQVQLYEKYRYNYEIILITLKK